VKKAEMIDDVASRLGRTARKYCALERLPIELPSGATVFGAEMHVAAAIGEGKASTVSELAQILEITKGAASQMVSKLEAKGFLRRETTGADGKTRRLALTPEGRGLIAIHARMHGTGSALVVKLSRAYSADRLREAATFLGDVEALLDALAEGAVSKGARP
jgi:DNA-binding MarR family transcriptional regulator